MFPKATDDDLVNDSVHGITNTAAVVARSNIFNDVEHGMEQDEKGKCTCGEYLANG